MSFSVANLGKHFRELRFIFCQKNERSLGMRNFVSNNYLKIKENNPDFNVVVRECEGADPYLIARYQYGVEKKAFTANLKEDEIQDIIKKLGEQSDAVNKHIQN